MLKYCEECNKEVETKIITKKECYNVCGETIDVDAQVLVCESCGEEFFCEELDNTTLLSAYNEYRRRHKLLLAEDIRKIREQYGLSQRSFAKLLNWGDKTICRYENGAIQDKAHNSLLLFLRNPQNMKIYLAENEILLDEKQKKKLLTTIDNLTLNTELSSSHAPSEENGFKIFDYEKLCAMVLFFAHKSDELLKTKLLKLLNYSDMVFYQQNGISISGCRYIHLPYGPVPENFDILLGQMTTDHVAHIDIKYEGGYEKHQIIPDCAFPDDILSCEELQVLEQVYNKFSTFGSAEISNYSHKEKGYRSTKQGDIISYTYAKDISF